MPFLAHADRVNDYEKNKTFKRWPETWFNSASDHCCELDISAIKNKKLHKEIKKWQEKVLHWGHGFSKPIATEKDVNWAIDQAKEFLRRIDEGLLKTKTIKGQWE